MAVPLVPPPEGEKFEGGYHVEKNPITGGARLVPPSPTGNKIKYISSFLWFVSLCERTEAPPPFFLSSLPPQKSHDKEERVRGPSRTSFSPSGKLVSRLRNSS